MYSACATIAKKVVKAKWKDCLYSITKCIYLKAFSVSLYDFVFILFNIVGNCIVLQHK